MKYLVLLLISLNAFAGDNVFDFWMGDTGHGKTTISHGRVSGSGSGRFVIPSDYPEISERTDRYRKEAQRLRGVREKRVREREEQDGYASLSDLPPSPRTAAKLARKKRTHPDFKKFDIDEDRIEKKEAAKIKRRKDIFESLSHSSGEEASDPFLSETREVTLSLNQASPRGRQNKAAKELGFISVNQAENSHLNGDEESANFFLEAAKICLEFALGMNPITGFAQDFHTLFLSKSATEVDRGLAFFGLITTSYRGGNILKAVKNVNRLFKQSHHLVRDAEIVAALIREGRSVFKANLDLTRGWIKTHRIVKILDAEVLNARFIKAGKQPPYKTGTDVFEFITQKEEQWVRVFGGKGSAEGDWLMRADAIRGLTPEQIQKKYYLKYTPTHVVDVHVPAGTSMYRGRAGWLDYYGRKRPQTVLEGSVQYNLKNGPLDAQYYQNIRLIEDL